MSRGVLYSAYGDNAIKECLKSIGSLKRINDGLPFIVLTDTPQAFRGIGAFSIVNVASDPYGRLAKLSADIYAVFDSTLYLDADTRVYADLSSLFCILESGWEFIVTLSANQGAHKWLQHVSETERDAALRHIGFCSAQLQGGVWGFRKTLNTSVFFKEWRERFDAGGGEHDQAAMQMAIRSAPMKFYLVGREFNGGGVIGHHFGQARRDDKRR